MEKSEVNMIKVSIVGASGYTGEELLRILSVHPEVELRHVTSRSFIGQKIQHLFPNLISYVDLTCEEQDIEAIAKDSDVVFAALPHGLSVPIAVATHQAGKKFIDLGADFRLNDVEEYEHWYNVKHASPELLKQAVYGLPEINREQVKQADILANPGCFPTSVQLALYPILQTDMVDASRIIIDSKSGTTGAGRSAKVDNLHAEAGENFKAYAVAGHRHIPEMEQELSKVSGSEVLVNFTPHLLPVARGILSTIYVQGKRKLDETAIRDLYEKAYADEPFVHVLPQELLPQIKHVRGSNHCHINFRVDERTDTLIIVSVIDNLVKGASGQAVQNMNLMFGLEETLGLNVPGLNP